MARMVIWLLAALVTVSLAHIIPIPQQGENTVKEPDPPVHKQTKTLGLLDLSPELLMIIAYWLPPDAERQFRITARLPKIIVKETKNRYFGGEVFATLRDILKLSPVKGAPNLVGLHTLLDGGQPEFRAMVSRFLDYLKANSKQQDTWKLEYPDLFEQYSFQGLDLPEFVNPWLHIKFDKHRMDWVRIKHSLSYLGQSYNTKEILAVVAALFAMLKSNDLLQNFETIVYQASAGQHGIQSSDSNERALAATSKARPEYFQAFVYRFWLEVIGGSNVKQLRYYLTNMLTFNVIPLMISRMLMSSRRNEVVELVQGISRIPDFIDFVNAYPQWAPNYFEFIVLFAFERRLAAFRDLVDAAYRGESGNTGADVQWMHNCFKYVSFIYISDRLTSIFNPEPLSDPLAWESENLVQCNQLYVKYMRNNDIASLPLTCVITFKDEDTAGLFKSLTE